MRGIFRGLGVIENQLKGEIELLLAAGEWKNYSGAVVKGCLRDWYYLRDTAALSHPRGHISAESVVNINSLIPSARTKMNLSSEDEQQQK
jgi:hypothetical protein